MYENMFLKEIDRLRAQFDKITKRIENEESLYWIHFEVEDLLKKSLILKKTLKFIKSEQEAFENVSSLVDQLKQLSHDITDILYIEHKIHL